MAARASRYEFTKPTWKSFFLYFGVILPPMVFVGWYMDRERVGPPVCLSRSLPLTPICPQVKKERLYRSGLIPYEMQHNKAQRVPGNVHQML